MHAANVHPQAKDKCACADNTVWSTVYQNGEAAQWVEECGWCIKKRAISARRARPRSGSSLAAISGHPQTLITTRDAGIYKHVSLLEDENTREEFPSFALLNYNNLL